jgi:hypothetical protein
MIKFKAQWKYKRNEGETAEEPSPELALASVPETIPRGKGKIVILKCLGGTDHPLNKGKFFLYQIV